MRFRGFSLCFYLPFIVALSGIIWPEVGQTQGLAGGSSPLDALTQLGLGRGLGQANGGQVAGQSPQQPAVIQPASPRDTLPLPSSRLEQIFSQRAGVKLQQFGYDQFGRGRAVTIPQAGALQDEYVLGPGDEVIVSLRGQESFEFRAIVDRNGQVVLPRLNPIPASGRTFGNFRQDMEAAVHRSYVATSAFVSIGQVRQISVLVSGEVNVPGQRLATGLSSVVDAILLSGGIKKTGSLRNIVIQRRGRRDVIDLYSVLTGNGSARDMRLADGDRIIVPPLSSAVAISGLVRRPGIYELAARTNNISARALLALAGGPEVRGQYRLSLQRVEADGRLNLVRLQEGSGLTRDGEILRVDLGADLSGTQATLSGGFGLAGQYPISGGTRLSEVIKAPGALGVTPYTLFGLIVRKDPRTLLRSLMSFTPVAVLSGTEDLPLQADDVVRPITVSEAQLLNYVTRTFLAKSAYDLNRIRNPLVGIKPQSNVLIPPTTPGGASTVAPASQSPAVTPDNPFGLEPGTLEDYSSGQEDLSGLPADLALKNIQALLDVAAPGSLAAQQRTMAYQQALLTASSGTNGGQSPTAVTQAQQTALIASQTGTLLQAPVGATLQAPTGGAPQYANGASQDSAGDQQIDNANDLNGSVGERNRSNAAQSPPNYQEQPVNSGGFASNREVHSFGELSRQLGVDPLVLVNFLIDHRARLDGAVRGPGTYFIGPNASLQDLVQAAGGTVSWADQSGVELLTTVVDIANGSAASQRRVLPLHQGNLASYVVRPHDQLHFNQVFTKVGVGSVAVQGEIRSAGNYPIMRGERLSELLMRAGGLTSTAYPVGTVFLRKSAAQVEEQGYKRTADEIQSQLIAGIARVGNDKITGEGYNAIQNFINQLRTQKALGRIAITADPSVLAANPQLDPLLEPGDVVFIPQRPSTITVLGEVMQPGSYSYRPGLTVADYIKRAGGYAQFSDDSLTFVVQPDGSARRLERSWLGYDAQSLPPGSSIVVPRDLAPLTTRQIILDTTGIFSSLAVTLASLAILAKQ